MPMAAGFAAVLRNSDMLTGSPIPAVSIGAAEISAIFENRSEILIIIASQY